MREEKERAEKEERERGERKREKETRKRERAERERRIFIEYERSEGDQRESRSAHNVSRELPVVKPAGLCSGQSVAGCWPHGSPPPVTHTETTRVHEPSDITTHLHH